MTEIATVTLLAWSAPDPGVSWLPGCYQCCIKCKEHRFLCKM